jgi:hypothetical protein
MQEYRGIARDPGSAGFDDMACIDAMLACDQALVGRKG